MFSCAESPTPSFWSGLVPQGVIQSIILDPPLHQMLPFDWNTSSAGDLVRYLTAPWSIHRGPNICQAHGPPPATHLQPADEGTRGIICKKKDNSTWSTHTHTHARTHTHTHTHRCNVLTHRVHLAVVVLQVVQRSGQGEPRLQTCPWAREGETSATVKPGDRLNLLYCRQQLFLTILKVSGSCSWLLLTLSPGRQREAPTETSKSSHYDLLEESLLMW